MKYSELKKAIKLEQKSELNSYIAYSENGLVSNFINTNGITDDQLIKAESEGLLRKDWDTYEVIK